MPGLRVKSIADLHPSAQDRLRSANPDVVAFIEATGLPEEVNGSSPHATGSRVDAHVAGPESGFVMLDYPISTNRYWRSFKGRTVVSAEARQYKAQAALLWGAMGLPLRAGPVKVELLLHPKTTKAGKASKTLMDLDNCIKVAIDALNGVAFIDDSQIVKLEATVVDPVPGGGLSVRVTA